jgi:uncharacterized protein (DUF952 family)
MLVYKILRDDEWAALQRDGATVGSPVDIRDGFVHLSSRDQVVETARRHFGGADGLHLLALDADQLGGALVWEPSRGGALFPHLYGALRVEDVCWRRPLPLVDGAHAFPDLDGAS